MFKAIAPDLQMPPEPVITCWGTGVLSVALYYAKNFKEFTAVIDELKADDAVSIQLTKDLIRKSS